MERYLCVADGQRLAEYRRLTAPGEVVAVARRHDLERLVGGQDGAMTGASVITMAVGDQRARHGRGRIDVEIARGAIEALRRWAKQGFGTHRPKLAMGDASVTGSSGGCHVPPSISP